MEVGIQAPGGCYQRRGGELRLVRRFCTLPLKKQLIGTSSEDGKMEVMYLSI